MTRNEVRIIAGKWRGRKVQFPDVAGLRPTPNRIRETLFNWLAPYIQDAECLDLFTGSGALCFEAISRGAMRAVSLEKNHDAYQALCKNAERLKADKLHILEKDALEWLSKTNVNITETFDIVFVDPPYALKALSTCFALLEKHGCLKIDSLIYFESDIPIESLIIPNTWAILKSKKAGNVYYYLTQKTT